MGPTNGLFEFPAEVNTVRAEKLHACGAFDTLNIWPPESASVAIKKNKSHDYKNLLLNCKNCKKD